MGIFSYIAKDFVGGVAKEMLRQVVGGKVKKHKEPKETIVKYGNKVMFKIDKKGKYIS